MSRIEPAAKLEAERQALDEHTIISIYHSGYSTITVKSIFSDTNTYSDLLYHIIQRKLNLPPTNETA